MLVAVLVGRSTRARGPIGLMKSGQFLLALGFMMLHVPSHGPWSSSSVEFWGESRAAFRSCLEGGKMLGTGQNLTETAALVGLLVQVESTSIEPLPGHLVIDSHDRGHSVR